MKKWGLTCLLLLAGIFVQLQAQTMRNFTPTQEGYLQDVNTLLSAANKKDAKTFVEEEFAPAWNSERFSDASRKRIYKISDEMLKKRLRAYPEFRDFFSSLVAFTQSRQSDESFDGWLTIMEELVSDRRKSNLVKFVENSASIFKDNTFYRSTTTAWQASNDRYTFEFDSIPKVVFRSMDLRCLAKNDSSVIYATSGVYYPTQDKFVGKGGRITWERAGLDPNETYGIIEGSYEIRTKGSSYSVDSVLFFNAFFDYPLQGIVSDKVLGGVREETASYPAFESYNKRLKIRDIAKDMDYEGGFSMRGNKLQGYGTPDQPASLTIFRDGYAFLQSRALNFTIRPDRIVSDRVAVTIYLDQDSITHPSLNFKFIKDTRTLSLIRMDEGQSKSPYFNTFHEVDMYFEALYWKIDDPLIRLGNLPGSTQNRAAFESNSYFQMQRYDALAGLSAMHPLFSIRKYAQSINSNEFYIEGLAADMRFPPEQIIPLLIDLGNKGFIDYDIERKHIKVKERLYNYILASGGRTDYDVIVFNSKTEREDNASINLLNYDMLLRGVERIFLSDSQNVVIYPQNGELLLKKNRDFDFAGMIRAGKFEFFGKEYKFTYDDFKIDLINVDSCRFYVERIEDRESTTRKGRPRMVRVKNVLEGIQGTISIDNPYNKSGVQPDYPQYPIFDCTKKPFVYYDNKQIQKGVYNRDRFYFQVEPFVIDSLNDFNTDQVFFDGTLVSADIFPDIEEQLRVQPDYSLGFVRQTGAAGLPLYGARGKYTDNITLNYNGLQGEGEMEYLTATASSENFIFFPDSTRGTTKHFKNLAQAGPPQVPEAHATEADLFYSPGKNLLRLDVMKEPISFFDEQSDLVRGYTELTPAGMTASGQMDFAGAELESDRMNLNQISFTSDTADFRLSAMNEAEMAFKTENVKADVQFDKRVAEFESNGDDTFVEFPINQYVCYMDKFKWFMDENSIELSSSSAIAADFVIDTELDLGRSNFYSTHPDQDSLNFMAPKAVYDLKQNIIDCKEIDHIRVADAKIIPDGGELRIFKKAHIEPLENAGIVANYITEYHRMFNAKVEIKSRWDYSGNAEYTYVDENKREQVIAFHSVKVDTSLQTVAEGQVLEDAQFMLSPNFEFIGRTRMEANNKFLTFKGSTRIAHNCPGIERNYMNFESEINPEEVMIPVDTMLVDYSGKPVGVGTMVNAQPYRLYSTFLSVKDDMDDEEVLSARGFLYFDKNAREYQVGSREKLRERKLPGNFVALNVDQCTVVGDGSINLGNDFGQVHFQPVGEARHNMQDEAFTMEATVIVNFHFLEDALKKMEEKINSYPDLKPVNIAETHYEKSIREIMGLEKSDKIITELSLSGGIKRLPQELTHTLYLANVKMKWNDLESAFQSEGPISIAHIGKKDVFRQVKGRIEIEKKRGGDELHIYLELDDANWFFFTYKRGMMRVFSSDNDFNNMLVEVKDDKRKAEGGKGKDPYTYMLGTKKLRNDFIRRFD